MGISGKGSETKKKGEKFADERQNVYLCIKNFKKKGLCKLSQVKNSTSILPYIVTWLSRSLSLLHARMHIYE